MTLLSPLVTIQIFTQLNNLAGGAQTDTGGVGIFAVLGQLLGGSLFRRLLRSGGVQEGDGRHAANALLCGQGGGELQKALSANEVGLESGTERVATPGDSRGFVTGAAQQGVVNDHPKRRTGRQLSGDRAANDGKDLRHGKTVLGEEAVSCGPILKLAPGSGE
jgi:hypothetical protein